MEHLFKPNEFYKMMGITRETMRHYIDKGLIAPAYTNEKGYSFYSEKEALQMMIIRFYRSCELPVESMKDFLWHMDLPAQVDELDQTIRSLDEQICRLQKKKQFLQARRRILYESGTYLNQPFLHEAGREMYLLNIAETVSCLGRDSVGIIRDLSLRFPMVHISLMADWKDFVERRPMKVQLEYGIVGKENTKDLDLSLFHKLSAQKCLVVRVCVKNPLFLVPEDLRPLYEKIQEEGYEVVDGVFGHLLSMEKEKDEFLYYITMRVHIR